MLLPSSCGAIPNFEETAPIYEFPLPETFSFSKNLPFVSEYQIPEEHLKEWSERKCFFYVRMRIKGDFFYIERSFHRLGR